MLKFSTFISMKDVFRKITSVLMALVVLFTTMSFSVGLHYCGDSLADVSLYSKSEGCGMEMEMDKTQSPMGCENPKMTKKSCCTDQQIVREGQDELKISFNQLTFEQQTFVATFVYSYINLFEGLERDFVPFTDYSPPFIERDVQILYSTYLI